MSALEPPLPPIPNKKRRRAPPRPRRPREDEEEEDDSEREAREDAKLRRMAFVMASSMAQAMPKSQPQLQAAAVDPNDYMGCCRSSCYCLGNWIAWMAWWLFIIVILYSLSRFATNKFSAEDATQFVLGGLRHQAEKSARQILEKQQQQPTPPPQPAPPRYQSSKDPHPPIK